MVTALFSNSSNFTEKPPVHIRVNLKTTAYGSPCTEQQSEPSMLSQSAIDAAVIGPDGRHITLADLPTPGIKRWVTRRKAEVVAAVRGGLLTEEDACRRYELSKEEFGGWERLYERHGVKGLRTTRLQNYR